jgi:hypothetical protein
VGRSPVSIILLIIFGFFEFDCEDSYKKPKKLFQCKFYFNSVSKVIAFLSLRQFIMVLMRRIFAALFPYLRKKVYFCILIAKIGGGRCKTCKQVCVLFPGTIIAN